MNSYRVVYRQGMSQNNLGFMKGSSPKQVAAKVIKELGV